MLLQVFCQFLERGELADVVDVATKELQCRYPPIQHCLSMRRKLSIESVYTLRQRATAATAQYTARGAVREAELEHLPGRATRVILARISGV